MYRDFTEKSEFSFLYLYKMDDFIHRVVLECLIVNANNDHKLMYKLSATCRFLHQKLSCYLSKNLNYLALRGSVEDVVAEIARVDEVVSVENPLFADFTPKVIKKYRKILKRGCEERVCRLAVKYNRNQLSERYLNAHYSTYTISKTNKYPLKYKFFSHGYRHFPLSKIKKYGAEKFVRRFIKKANLKPDSLLPIGLALEDKKIIETALHGVTSFSDLKTKLECTDVKITERAFGWFPRQLREDCLSAEEKFFVICDAHICRKYMYNPSSCWWLWNQELFENDDPEHADLLIQFQDFKLNIWSVVENYTKRNKFKFISRLYDIATKSEKKIIYDAFCQTVLRSEHQIRKSMMRTMLKMAADQGETDAAIHIIKYVAWNSPTMTLKTFERLEELGLTRAERIRFLCISGQIECL